MHVCSADSVTSTLCDSLRPYGLEPTRLLCPWDSPGKDTGVGGHALLQAIFQTQGLNLGPPVSPALQADSFHCWVTTEAPIWSKNLFWKWKLAGPIFKLQLEAVIPRRPEKEKKREQEWGREAWAEAPTPRVPPGPEPNGAQVTCCSRASCQVALTIHRAWGQWSHPHKKEGNAT